MRKGNVPLESYKYNGELMLKSLFTQQFKVFPVNREHQRKFLECLLFRDQSDAR